MYIHKKDNGTMNDSNFIYRKLKPCNVLVLHEPGAGGQFFCNMVGNLMLPPHINCTPPMTPDNNSSNEYNSDLAPLITATHFQTLFRRISSPSMRDAQVTIQQYRHILNWYKNTKIINLVTGKNYQDYVKILGQIKLLQRPNCTLGEYEEAILDINTWKLHNNTDKRCEHSDIDYWNSHTDKFIKHHVARGGQSLTVEYEDFFINFNSDVFCEVVRFCVGGDVISTAGDDLIPNHKRSIVEYRESNYRSIDTFSHRWS